MNHLFRSRKGDAMKLAHLTPIATCLAFAAAILLSFACLGAQPAYAEEQLAGASFATAAPTPELDKVKARFPQTVAVIETTDETIEDDLSAAGGRAQGGAPVIVHATGTITAHGLVVPKNVILVSEASTVYTYDGTGNGGTYFVRMWGSVFGGTFDGKTCYYNILAKGTVGGGANGYVEDVVIKSGRVDGISATSKASGIRVSNCKISNLGRCGVHAESGSTLACVQNCQISDVGQSGVDLLHANATEIKNNVIKNCKGHGISTDTEHGSICPQQNDCKITRIAGNTISNCKHHGIYLEDRVKVNYIQNNKIFSNTRTGLNVMKNAIAKVVTRNDIYGNKHSNITVSGKNATVKLGSSNKIRNAKGNGINVSAGGKLYILGAGNKIYSNRYNGINLTDKGSYLKITGKKTQVSNHRNNGISFSTKSRGSIANVTFAKNKHLALYVGAKCKCTYKKCNLSRKSGAKNRAYFA